MQIDVNRRIAAPVDRVWALITDIANSPQVMTAIESVELLAGHVVPRERRGGVLLLRTAVNPSLSVLVGCTSSPEYR